MTDNIDITGLDPAAVLAGLYNNSFVQGMGILQAKPGLMSVEEARAILDANAGSSVSDGYSFAGEQDSVNFDYLFGKVMKVKIPLNGGSIDPWGYDRDVGEGAAAAVISALRLASVPS